MALNAIDEARKLYVQYGKQAPLKVISDKIRKKIDETPAFRDTVKVPDVLLSVPDQIRNQFRPTIAGNYQEKGFATRDFLNRVLQTPVVPMVPNTTLKDIGNASRNIGQQLQRVNVPKINIPDASIVPGGNSFSQAIKSTFPITQLPEQINQTAQSYGRTLSNPMGNPVETALNVVPFAGTLKPLRSASKMATKQGKLFNEAQATKPTIAEQLGKIDTSSLRKQPGSFTNIREADNPLLKGSEGVKELRATISERLASLRQSFSPRVGERVRETIKNDFNPQTPIGQKINILDYVRTPDRVLKKMGLSGEAKTLRTQYEKYLDELPQELNKIESWSKQVSPESNERIFRQLDGENILLNPKEQQVASEIKTYLGVWAQKLGLPKDKRIKDYITHIYEKGAIEQDFPEDIAKLIQGKIPKDVYNPFTQRRISERLDYKKDTWAALEAYVKRGTRQYNLQPALEAIEKRSGGLEKSQADYLLNLTERINMRPTEIDTLIDNAVKASPIGYKLGQRPVTSATRALRQQVYRGTLGLNVSTALRNLTQVANTYAKLGEKYTAKGYLQLAKQWNSGELEKVGVLRDSIMQDKRITAIKKTIDVMDKGLFYLFEKAEKINRGSAYYGAKSKALSEGMNESQAIEYAKKIVRDTQFQFGSIDTPVSLQSDIAKTLTQFMSFPIKQTEFLGEMITNKEWAGLMRWIGSTLVMGKVLKDTFGLSLEVLPFQSVLTGETRFGDVPLVKTGRLIGQYAFGDEDSRKEAGKELGKTARTFIPGGVQLGKTAEALGAMSEGASFTPSGKMRFEVKPSLKTAIFGIWSTPEAQEYLKDRGMIQSSLSPEERAAKDFKKQEAKIKAQEDRMATKLYIQLKNTPKEERAALIKAWRSEGLLTPELTESLKKQGEKEKQKNDTKFAGSVRSIQSNEAKARFIRMYLKKTIKERRAGYIAELRQSGLLTPGLLTELNKQARGSR